MREHFGDDGKVTSCVLVRRQLASVLVNERLEEIEEVFRLDREMSVFLEVRVQPLRHDVEISVVAEDGE